MCRHCELHDLPSNKEAQPTALCSSPSERFSKPGFAPLSWLERAWAVLVLLWVIAAIAILCVRGK